MAVADEAARAAPPRIRVVVAASRAARTVAVQVFDLPAGATVAQALAAAGCTLMPGEQVGVWGRVQPLDAPLREADRVEIYRPLTVDPKEARRQRYRRSPQRHKKLGQKGGPQPG